MLIAFAVHVAAAFIHPFVFRDQITQRMLPDHERGPALCIRSDDE
ncbi:hypothetical protein [Afipia broomeae]|nr:hypothetical protein [Afipia broomeae]